MNVELVRLLDLQARDLDLVEAEGRLTAVLDQVAELDRELERAREAVRDAERALDAGRQRRDDLEQKVEAHRRHQEKRKEKLGFLHSPKEVQSVMAEIDLAASVIVKEEAEWVGTADQVKALEIKLKEAGEIAASVEAGQGEPRAALAGQQAALEAERDAARARRAGSAAEVDKPLLTRYDRLRSSRNAAVVVALTGAACGACYTTIPLNRRTQMRNGSTIEFCESCGVILYQAEES